MTDNYLNPVTAKDEAYNAITQKFQDFLDRTDMVCEFRFQGKPTNSAPTNQWVMFSMQQVLSTLKGYVCSEDGMDNQLYETTGLFFAQVNVAISSDDAFRVGDVFATILRDFLKSTQTPGGLWFRNCRFNEIPSDGEFYKWNVVGEYEFDEIDNSLSQTVNEIDGFDIATKQFRGVDGGPV